MNREEYNVLFHKHQLNLVAFKRLNDCDEEVLRLVNAAIEAEREACARVADEAAENADDPFCCRPECLSVAASIRARGETK